jgi:DNA-binding NarL/FixJ family response regulator
MTMSIEVILADDHAIVRDGIKALVARKGEDITVIGEASNGKEVLELAKSNPADVYVIDAAMPILNGIETIERLKKIDKNCKIIILSMHDDRNFVEKALKYGANGYILKESATDEIIHAIREVYADKFFLSPKISRFIVDGFLGKRYTNEHDKEVVDLTKREKEILQLIAEGFTNKEIAVQLKLSLNTVHVHRNNIMKKLDIHRQADLVRYALKEGLSHL